MESPSPNSRWNLLVLGLLVEGGLVILALLLGWFGLYDQSQPLEQLFNHWTYWKKPIWLGLAATIPMLGYLILFHFRNPKFQRPMQKFVDQKLRPMFRQISLLEMFTLSLMAGVGEELFFRWCLQGGLACLLTPMIGSFYAIAVGIFVASLIFGACHWVNATYGITTMLVGIYLGVVMVWSESWLVPALAHALFDFVAMIYMAKVPERDQRP